MTTNPEPKSRLIKPTSQPITTLSTPAARAFAQIHPVLLSAYFYLHFPSLVAAPIPTLFTDLIPLSLLQITYAVLCLPPTKTISANPPPPKPKSTKQNPKKRLQPSSQKPWQDLPRKLSTALLALTLTAVASTPVLTILLILFGAPLTTHHAQTYLCVCHIALLAVFPLFYVHGVSSSLWHEITGVMLPFDEVWGATVGCFLGAWLGAVPIPLDWDREWQKWPVTIVTGAYMGYVVGKLAGGYLLHGKRIEFD